jgi:5'-phosphate synthase pdxT subunit
MIVMARRVTGVHGPLLGMAEVTVERNSFGRQVDTFEKDISVRGLDDQDRPFRGVFIRAPVITEVGTGVEVMARLEQGIVMARDGNILLGAFHPELTDDTRIHRYFLDMVKEHRERLEV